MIEGLFEGFMLFLAKNIQSIIDKSVLLVVKLSIFIGVFGIVVWAAFAELDIVVSARGEIVSESDVEKIQHREGGILDALLVSEGSYVYQGQEIARLRALERDGELATKRVEMIESAMEIERLNALTYGEPPNFHQHSDDDALISFHQRIWLEEDASNRKIDALLEHDIAHKSALIASMKTRLKSSRQQLGIIAEQSVIKEQLYEEDIIPYLQVLDTRIQVKNMEREIQNLQEAILNEGFALDKVKKQLDETRAKRKAEYLAKLSEAKKKSKITREQLPNIEDQVERLVVTSPIDGYVNEIHYNYKSAVISAGESIADISPVRSALIGEAKIPRKDIGFVEVGQFVRVKMDTFPFTKYGSLEGEVTAISKNSYEEKEQMFYIAKVALRETFLENAGVQYHMSPDMEFVADIKTGSRKVLDYALKPIMIALEQSFGER